jgi:hypothetical protein
MGPVGQRDHEQQPHRDQEPQQVVRGTGWQRPENAQP